MENSAPGSSVATVSRRRRERLDVGVVGVGAVVDGRRAQLDGELDALPGPELAGVHAQASPAAAPACRIVRASSTSNAPRSQNTSIQRACGRHAASMSPATRLHVVVAAVAVLGGHHVRTEKRGLRGELAGDPQRPGFVGDGQAVPALGLERGDAAARSSSASRATLAASSLVGRPPGSPPPWSRCRRRRRAAPAIRAANSAERSPANTRCAWLSTNPGNDRCAPPQSTRCVGGGRLRARPDPGDAAVLDDHRGVGDDAERRPVALRRVVGDEFADVGVRERSSALHRSRLSPQPALADVRERDVVCRSATTVPAVDDHVGDVGRRGGEDDVLRRWRRRPRYAPTPGRRRPGRRAHRPASAPASVQPSARWPAAVAASSSVAAEMSPRSRRASRSSSSTARASSNRSITAWLSEPRLNGPAPVEQRRRGSDAVAEVAFGGGAEADAGGRAVAGRRCPVGQVGGVHRGGAGPENSVVAHAVRSACSRAPPGTRRPRRVCSDEWTCSGASWRVGPLDDGGHLGERHRAHGMYCGADDHLRPVSTSPCSDSTRSAQAWPLPSPNRCCGPSASGAPSSPELQIAGVQQGQRGSRRRRRGDQRRAHRIRVGVRPAAGVVVQVVEFADRGDSGQRHLGVDGAGQVAVARPGSAVRGVRTSAFATSRSCRGRAGCATAAPGGTRASARWPAPGSPDRAAVARRCRRHVRSSTAVIRRRVDGDQHTDSATVAAQPGVFTPAGLAASRVTPSRP